MTDLEIQTWIEENMYHPDGTPMIDVQSFYEGAKWMRNKALDTSNVSDLLSCHVCGGTNYYISDDGHRCCKRHRVYLTRNNR